MTSNILNSTVNGWITIFYQICLVPAFYPGTFEAQILFASSSQSNKVLDASKHLQ